MSVVAGSIAFSISESTPGRVLAPGRAVFLATSAATLTGFTPSWLDLHSASSGTHVTYAALISIGVVSCWTIGGLAIAHIWRRLRGVKLILTNTQLALFFAVSAVFTLGLSALFEAWAGRPWLDGMTVLAGAGLTTGPRPADLVFWTWYIPQAAAGVIAPAALMVAAYRADERALPENMPTAQLHLSYATMAIAFAVSLVLMLATSGLSSNTAGLASDARSNGFLDASSASSAGRWTLVPLMLLGSAGGGTAGGLKVTTAAILLIGLFRLLRGRPVGRTFAIALAWLLGLVVIFVATFITLIAVLPQLPAGRIAILAAGSVGTTGLSIDPVVASGLDAWIMSAAMFLGRVLPWAVLWWSATTGDEEVVVG